MANHTLFISHKHLDSRLAQTLGRFIKANSGGRVNVHLSSDPAFRGPEPGARLIDQLQDALWKTQGLILVYTTEEHDWSYCMWECGTAVHPSSPDTRLFVLQCGAKAPSVFAHDVATRARSLEDVQRFVELFFRKLPFPGQTEPLCPGWDRENVVEAAKILFEELAKCLPKHDYTLVDEWSSWPWLALTLPAAIVDDLRALPHAERPVRMLTALRSDATVKSANVEASQMLGRHEIKPAIKFGELVDGWEHDAKKDASVWLLALAEQISKGLERKMVLLSRRPIHCLKTQRALQPMLSAVSQIDVEERFELELLFIDLGDPRTVPVTERMLPIETAFYKIVEGNSPDEIGLIDLRNELESSGRNRVPLIRRDRTPAYIIHLSMIDQYLVKRAMRGGMEQLKALTAADILSDDHFGPMFENTFAVVASEATLAEAQQAMRDRHGSCRDVFVTRTGRPDEPVLGWLTNVDALM